MKQKIFIFFPCVWGILGLGWLPSLPVMAASAPADSYSFRRLTSTEGLVSDVVFSLYQDSRGFVWIGTTKGVDRYDGIRFSHFAYDPTRPDWVLSIAEDADGDMWFGNYGGGLDRFDRRSGKFERFLNRPGDSRSLSNNVVSHVAASPTDPDTLWICTFGGGLNRFSRREKTFTQLPIGPGGLSDMQARRAFQDRAGQLWVTHDRGIDRLDLRSGQVRNYSLVPPLASNAEADVTWPILESREEGIIWIGSNFGLSKMATGSGAFVTFSHDPANPSSISHNYVRTILALGQGRYLIGTEGGLNLFLSRDGKFRRILNQANDQRSLSHNAVRFLMRDRSGLVWVATMGGGVNLLDIDHVHPHTFRFQNDPNAVVSALCRDDNGRIWAATRGRGVFRIEPETSIFTPFPLDSVSAVNHEEIIVYQILDDEKGSIWLASNQGLVRFDQASGKLTSLPCLPDDSRTLSGKNIICLLKTRDGFLWIGTDGAGFNCLTIATGECRRYRLQGDNQGSIAMGTATCFMEDRSGKIWIGSTGATLNRLDPKTEAIHSFKLRLKELSKKAETEITVTKLHECAGEPGIIWAATTVGLVRFNTGNGKTKHYSTAQGLRGEKISGILDDERGNLWLTTDRGIIRFHRKTETFVAYGTQEGLLSNDYQLGCAYQSREGDFLFGSVNGVDWIRPEWFDTRSVSPQIQFTGLSIQGKAVPIGSRPDFYGHFAATGSLKLSYKEAASGFSLSFALLDFHAPAKNQYSYRLDGRDRDWVLLGNQNEVAFRKLSPGKYILHVRGCNHQGIWSDQPLSLSLTIWRPFWQAPLVWGLFFGIIATGAGILLRRSKTEKPFTLPPEEADLSRYYDRHKISKREAEIIELVIRGKTNQEIEDELFISIKTVKVHLYNIYQKLEVKNRLQLINKLQGEMRKRQN